MNLRRVSLGFTVAGGVLLVAATTLLVSVSFGRVEFTTTDANGRAVTQMFSTPSVLQDSPRLAANWIAATVVVSAVLGLLIRYGGVVGPVLVIGALQLVIVAGILTIGRYLVPGAGCLVIAAVLALADWQQRRHPAPPPTPNAAPLRPAPPHPPGARGGT